MLRFVEGTDFLQMMLLDVLDNLPRLRMSSNQFKMILWLLKECHVRDVPSFDAFRKMQHGLRGACGTQPTVHKSSVGNIFYVNDVRESVARVCTGILLMTGFHADFKSRILPIQRLSNTLSSILKQPQDQFRRSGKPPVGKNSNHRNALRCMHAASSIFTLMRFVDLMTGSWLSQLIG